MQNLVFTQLSVPEVRQLFREELQEFFKRQSTPQNTDDEIGGLELAEHITGLKRPTIYNLVSERQIPFSKKGKRLYFYKKDLLKWLEQGKRKTQTELAAEAGNYSGNVAARSNFNKK